MVKITRRLHMRP